MGPAKIEEHAQKMRARAERKRARQRAKNRHNSPAQRAQRDREGNAFRRISAYLNQWRQHLAREKYITAMYGCKTTWSAIERQGILYDYSRQQRRSDRPPSGGNWQFEDMKRRPRAAV